MPDNTDPKSGPISQVGNRMVPRGAAMGSTLDARIAHARGMLSAFVAEAQATPPQLKAEFDLFGAGKLGVSRVESIVLADDKESAENAFTISFEYRGREPLTHVTQSEALHSKLRKSLFDAGLHFKTASATVYKITVDPVVTGSVRLSANRETGNIQIRLRNVTLFGTVEYDIPAAQLTNEFVESLGTLVGSHANTFYALASAVSRPKRY